MKDHVEDIAIRFGPFELRTASEELLRDGHPIKLQPHPFAVLTYLAVNSGRVVTREELYGHVWGETIVEWDKGLNYCIRQVRMALGDTASSPSFVLTHPRKGYRFIAPTSHAPASIEQRQAVGSTRGWGLITRFAALVVLCSLTVGGVALATRARERPTGMPVSATPEALAYYHEGNEFFRRNLVYRDVLTAVERYSRSIEEDPDFAPAHAMLGIAKLTLVFEWSIETQRESAYSQVAEAIELAPADPIVLLAQGYREYYGHGDYDAALAPLELARQFDPNNPHILLATGYIHRRKGDWSLAIELFERANALDHGLQEVTWALARTYARVRRFDDADRYLRQTTAILPDFLPGRSEEALNHLRRDGDAVAAFEVVGGGSASVSPSLVLYDRVLSRCLARQIGAREVAGWASERADVGEVTYHSNKAEMLSLLGLRTVATAHWDSALVVLERRYAENPQNGYVAVLLARTTASLGQTETARDYLAKAVALTPGIPDSYAAPDVTLLRAEVLVRIGEMDEALALLEQLLQVPSSITPALLLVDPIWEPLRDHPTFVRLVGQAAVGVTDGSAGQTPSPTSPAQATSPAT